jgi:hypothetical protein
VAKLLFFTTQHPVADSARNWLERAKGERNSMWKYAAEQIKINLAPFFERINGEFHFPGKLEVSRGFEPPPTHLSL